MNISPAGIALIKSFEGLRLKAYKCPAGVWTIGWGSTKYANGSAVKSTDSLVNRECADDLFLITLKSYVDAVNKGLKVPVNQNQFDALVSIAYNVGTGIMANSVLIKKLNAKDYTGAAEQFLVWDKITKNGVKEVSDTLAKRRTKERALFLKAA